MQLHKILLATDYTELSQTALSYAAALAHSHGAQVIIVHVVDTLGPEKITFAEAVSQPQPAGYRNRLWEELHKVQLRDSQVTVEYVLAEGEPAQAIVQAAQEKQCDLIVMGSHGRSGMRRWLEGSVAEHVVRYAHCPVLVVKEPIPVHQTAADKGTDLHPHQLSEQEAKRG